MGNAERTEDEDHDMKIFLTIAITCGNGVQRNPRQSVWFCSVIMTFYSFLATTANSLPSESNGEPATFE